MHFQNAPYSDLFESEKKHEIKSICISYLSANHRFNVIKSMGHMIELGRSMHKKNKKNDLQSRIFVC